MRAKFFPIAERSDLNFRCPFCKCVLKVERGKLVGQQFRIAYPRTTIGRGKECVVVLSDPYVSRLHCELIYQEGKLELRDNGSTGGTRLNGLQVNRAIILPDDILKVGRTKLRIDCQLSLLQPVCGLFGRFQRGSKR